MGGLNDAFEAAANRTRVIYHQSLRAKVIGAKISFEQNGAWDDQGLDFAARVLAKRLKNIHSADGDDLVIPLAANTAVPQCYGVNNNIDNATPNQQETNNVGTPSSSPNNNSQAASNAGSGDGNANPSSPGSNQQDANPYQEDNWGYGNPDQDQDNRNFDPEGVENLPPCWDGSGNYCPADRTDGCYIAGTRIAVADGVDLPIELIRRDMPITTLAGRSSNVLRVEAGPEPLPVITVRTDQGQALTVTEGHPMMTASGLKPARDLTLEDRMLTAAGDHARITELRRDRYNGMVFNFSLPGKQLDDHLVVAEGLVVGDLHLQKQLERNNPALQLVGIDSATSTTR
jgi:hypothetical protein